MKDVFWGGELSVLVLQEMPKDFEARVAKGWEKDSVVVPVGTEVRLERFERRNLIDHGVEVLAFGQIRHPQTGKMEPFTFWITDDGGNVTVRAPWEDSTVPDFRSTEMTGIRDFGIGAPVNAKKD